MWIAKRTRKRITLAIGKPFMLSSCSFKISHAKKTNEHKRTCSCLFIVYAYIELTAIWCIFSGTDNRIEHMLLLIKYNYKAYHNTHN